MNGNTLYESTRNVAQTLIESLKEFGGVVLDFIPNLVGAMILIFIGKLVASLIETALVKLLELLKVEMISEKVGITQGIKATGLKIKVVDIFGILAYWVVYLVFILAAVEVLGVESISDIVSELIAYIPNLIGALIVMLIGITVANYIQKAINQVNHGKLLGKVAYILILVVVAISAIEQVGIEISFLTDNLQIIVAGLSLAFGLAFGLGGKERAKKIIDHFSTKSMK